jgi:hypothetical protein
MKNSTPRRETVHGGIWCRHRERGYRRRLRGKRTPSEGSAQPRVRTDPPGYPGDSLDDELMT